MRWHRSFIVAVFVLPVLAASVPAAAEERTPSTRLRGPYTVGQLLVATTQMGDPRFKETVIYMVNHGSKGALGLVVNRLYGSGPMHQFLKGLGMEIDDARGELRVYYGGPVEPGRGFVLHSSDYSGPGTMAVKGGVSVSMDSAVLKAMAEGRGPRQSLFALGYAGWAPGQLEGEIARGDWVTAPADEALVFDERLDDKWKRAAEHAGVAL